MQVTVELQDNYSYAPIFLLVAIILVGIALLILWAMRQRSEKKVPVTGPVQTAPRRPAPGTKEKYDRMLAELVQKFTAQQISERQAYQKLSKTVRQFVFEMTGIKVQNYTLQEIRAVNMPQLTALIEECYDPEFASDNQSEFMETVNKARKVIREWI